MSQSGSGRGYESCAPGLVNSSTATLVLDDLFLQVGQFLRQSLAPFLGFELTF